MEENIFLSIIIPAYNEGKAIEATLKEIAEYIRKNAFVCEVIVVDDGSGDNTFANAERERPLFARFNVIRNLSNRGKGYSVKRAMLEARGEIALFMDADSSTSIYEFDKFLPFIKEKYDIVIASRRLKDSIVKESQPLIRSLMGKFFIFISRITLNLKFSDFNCGFKVYTNEAAKLLFKKQKMNDWSFDVELLFLANKFDLSTKEVPVRWVHKSGSKVKPLRDGIKSFVSLIKIKLNDVKCLYGSR
jgi:dolichyl-phosphate beta-glucosyltransferase